jgi:hypothetical protein
MDEIKKQRFNQEENGRWYLDLPEYIESGLGSKANLEMIAGADKLLSKFAQGRSAITLRFQDTEFEGYEIELIRSSDTGYKFDDIEDI